VQRVKIFEFFWKMLETTNNSPLGDGGKIKSNN
jgi:hypothetical protein